MNDSAAAATPRQALLNRAREGWDTHFGAPAWAAIALGAVTLLLQFQMRPAQERALAAVTKQRAHAEQTAGANHGTAGAGQNMVRDPLSQALPEANRRGKDIGMLLDTAKRSRLAVERADYSVEPVSGVALTRLHANLPVSGSYSDVRQFIAGVLNAMPNATLESLQIERADTQSTQLQATLRIVLFYRTGR